jgi:hypothetical protein
MTTTNTTLLHGDCLTIAQARIANAHQQADVLL